jgi:hypothetical protein
VHAEHVGGEPAQCSPAAQLVAQPPHVSSSKLDTHHPPHSIEFVGQVHTPFRQD